MSEKGFGVFSLKGRGMVRFLDQCGFLVEERGCLRSSKLITSNSSTIQFPISQEPTMFSMIVITIVAFVCLAITARQMKERD